MGATPDPPLEPSRTDGGGSDALVALAIRRRARRDPASAPLVWVSAAAAAGWGLEGAMTAGGAPPAWVGSAAAVGLTAWFALWRLGRDAAACAVLLLSVALAAAAWEGVAWRLVAADDLGRYAPADPEPAAVELVALAAPTWYGPREPSPFRTIPVGQRSVIPVTASAIRDGRRWRACSGVSEVVVLGDVRWIRAGDRLLAFGQLRRPRPASNPGGRDEAYDARAERRFAALWCEAAECVERAQAPRAGGALGRLADGARGALAAAMDRRLGSAAPLARAMLLGEIAALDEATIEAFRRSGTVHVLVVSGMHVALVAMLGPVLVRGLGLSRAAGCVASLAAAVGYAWITGAEPPATRAAVVVAAACVAAMSGRAPLGANSLAGAALAIFAASPGAWSAAGTQLSFLATATLLAVGAAVSRRDRPDPTPIERLVRRYRPRRERIARRAAAGMALVFAAGCAVLAAAWPLVASRFHQTPLLGPAVSVLASPCLFAAAPLALGVGAADATCTAALPEGGSRLVAPLLAPATSVASAAILTIGSAAMLAGSQAWASPPTAGPAEWCVGAWAVWLGLGAACWAYWPSLRGLWLRAGLALLAAGMAPPLARWLVPASDLRVTFLSVGHGAATLIEAPGGGTILCDAGALAEPDRVADEIARALWRRGVTRLDAVILSHADADHYNALPGLMERLPVGAVWTTPRMLPRAEDEADRSGPAELKRLLARRGATVRELVMGDRLRVGSEQGGDAVTLEALHPSELGVLGTDNANSLVLALEGCGRRVLLTGDLESPGLEMLLAQEPYDCDVLAAPHHGSARSDPPGLAAWCRPELVVVSSGGPDGEAAAAYRRTGAAVANTHLVGAIEVRLDRGGIEVLAGAPRTPWKRWP